MIVGKEGQPRSGKSYETVKLDILEALKAERRVYARLNGLDHEKIAAYIDKPVERVRELLYVLRDDEVLSTLVCDTQPDGSLSFPHIERGALVIVDEVHEYWPTGRAPLAQRNEDFFAKHGHVGLDVCVMSQDFKEVHRSIVRRLQRKNLYVKLDALGKDQSYSVRMYTAPAAGKFELMGSEKRDYDPSIFPLYHGIQPGVESNAVYKTGSRTLWQTAKKPAILVAIALVVGLFFIFRFFTGGGGVVPETKATKVVPVEAKRAQAVQAAREARGVLPQPVTPVTAPKPPKPAVKYPAGVAYVVDLLEDGRARFAGKIGGRMLLEIRQPGGGQVLERLTSQQFEALGWTVESMPYGARATYADKTVIFTPWPVDLQGEQSQQTANNIRMAGAPVASASEPQPRPAYSPSVAAGTGTAQAVAASYGGMRGQVGRPPAPQGL